MAIEYGNSEKVQHVQVQQVRRNAHQIPFRKVKGVTGQAEAALLRIGGELVESCSALRKIQ